MLSCIPMSLPMGSMKYPAREVNAISVPSVIVPLIARYPPNRIRDRLPRLVIAPDSDDWMLFRTPPLNCMRRDLMNSASIFSIECSSDTFVLMVATLFRDSITCELSLAFCSMDCLFSFLYGALNANMSRLLSMAIIRMIQNRSADCIARTTPTITTMAASMTTVSAVLVRISLTVPASWNLVTMSPVLLDSKNLMGSLKIWSK